MNWQIAYTDRPEKIKNYLSAKEIVDSGIQIMSASVPGCFQADLIKNCIEPDFYYSSNILKNYAYEKHHVWYFSEFDAKDGDYLHFCGIDTVADIIINGKKVMSVNNMFLPYNVSENISEGVNEVIVHIIPAVSAASEYPDFPDYCFAYKYNWESLYIRKAPHMYGWDILPRIITSGIWKPVVIKNKYSYEIDDIHIYTKELSQNHDKAVVSVNAVLPCSFCSAYKVTVSDGLNEFTSEGEVIGENINTEIDIVNPRLWWPKNYGEQFLYKITVKAFGNDGEPIVEKQLYTGIRTVSLVFELQSSKKPDGDFCFIINGKRVFLNGTNWVPLDAMHIEDNIRVPKAIALMNDLNCNIVRCWGGNVYEEDEFFELCDKSGILVWQDFSMACAVYPRDSEFSENLRLEAEAVVKRLRNHPCIALFAGDNECDLASCDWKQPNQNPDDNTLTRVLLPEAVKRFAAEIPYLPSSPYVTEFSMHDSSQLPENHLWGPRDYFKSEFYRENRAVFASETGYFGMPSPESLKKFIAKDKLWPFISENGDVNEDYMLHCTAMETAQSNPYSYRMHLLARQVDVLFGKGSDSLDEFCMESQISQAEAMKYFIERFRVKNPERTGIIWWNLIDGWPEVSDAIVDFYFSKKLAYHYIKRTQKPLCLMIEEPGADGRHILHAVNDSRVDENVKFTVKDMYDESRIIAEGECSVCSDDNVVVAKLELIPKHFYFIEWICSDGNKHSNHYFSDIGNIDFAKYAAALKKCGYYQFDWLKD